MQKRRSPNTIQCEIVGKELQNNYRVEGTSAGHLGKIPFQGRDNFEVGSGCSGLYPIMFFIL